MTLPVVEGLPSAASVKLIPFDDAVVVGGFAGGYILIVRGSAPCFNMQVSLSPLIYVTCPDYWGIEVIGSLPGSICLDTIKPYKLTLSLDGITGWTGIEVIGSNKRMKFTVAGGCQSGASLS